jgi:hypothetical protein
LWDDIGVPDAPQPFQPETDGTTWRPDAPWRPAAVIRHETAGGAHFDLLLARREPEGPDDRACATWRAARDPAALAVGAETPVEPIADHRAHYLGLAGHSELSGGRGRVLPVARGAWRPGMDGAVEVRWDEGTTARYRLDAAGAPAAMLRRIAR